MQTFDNTQFEKFRALINSRFGIYIAPTKKDILNTKLNKLMQRNKIASYDEYFYLLSKNQADGLMTEFTNAITVNKTSFFRETIHFEFIRSNIGKFIHSCPGILQNREIRIWSSACSTGEEAYTLAMVLQECLPEGFHMKILATDINSQVIAKAQKAVYPPTAMEDVEKIFVLKYFTKTDQGFALNREIKEKVTFRLFNLMEPFPFKHHFDIIFCRNVMIYFDTQTKKVLLEKFHRIMNPGSLLFIGHSESITTQNGLFRYIYPTVYSRI